MATVRVGWIGTGVMGRSMCGHLLAAGNPVRVYNRSKEKTADLAAKGAVVCDSPADVARESDVIFSIVGFPRDVEEVILGENGVVANAPKGAVVVDMTTSEPSLAQRIDAAARAAGLTALDAPVSGGDLGAREATLAIMVGGEQATFARVKPLLDLMGRNVRLMGGAGAGQHTKMCNQILIAGTMIGVVESLLYAQRAGMDLDAVIDVIGSGAAGSWSINNLGRRIAKGDFNPGFFIKHFVKDMGIALAEAKAMNLSLPGLALAHQFYIAAQALGHEDLGTQGLYKVLAHMNGM
ncbi:6-phosphogluconate dehydrogenase NAD-binding protein [Desulfovibrio sp. X2]|nr:6-phosphogluconate dehydrogenase NAD-binding protein [Desulfovibrio sp. X2]